MNPTALGRALTSRWAEYSLSYRIPLYVFDILFLSHWMCVLQILGHGVVVDLSLLRGLIAKF